jgi:hypothetical protein
LGAPLDGLTATNQPYLTAIGDDDGDGSGWRWGRRERRCGCGRWRGRQGVEQLT